MVIIMIIMIILIMVVIHGFRCIATKLPLKCGTSMVWKPITQVRCGGGARPQQLNPKSLKLEPTRV